MKRITEDQRKIQLRETKFSMHFRDNRKNKKKRKDMLGKWDQTPKRQQAQTQLDTLLLN